MSDFIINLICVIVGAILGFILPLLHRLGKKIFACKAISFTYKYPPKVDGTGGFDVHVSDKTEYNGEKAIQTIIRMEILCFNGSDLPYSISNPTILVYNYDKSLQDYKKIMIENVSFYDFGNSKTQIVDGRKSRQFVATITIKDIVEKDVDLKFNLQYYDINAKLVTKKIKILK